MVGQLIIFTAAEVLGSIDKDVQITVTKVGVKLESTISKTYILPLIYSKAKTVKFKVYRIY